MAMAAADRQTAAADDDETEAVADCAMMAPLVPHRVPSALHRRSVACWPASPMSWRRDARREGCGDAELATSGAAARGTSCCDRRDASVAASTERNGKPARTLRRRRAGCTGRRDWRPRPEPPRRRPCTRRSHRFGRGERRQRRVRRAAEDFLWPSGWRLPHRRRLCLGRAPTLLVRIAR
eukprot:COSAG06_NODE_7244_length_2573_cov_2.809620_2_plen_180_part_00